MFVSPPATAIKPLKFWSSFKCFKFRDMKVNKQKNHLSVRISHHLNNKQVDIFTTHYILSGRCGGLMVGALDSKSRGEGSRPSQFNMLYSWAKHFTLSPGSYQPKESFIRPAVCSQNIMIHIISNHIMRQLIILYYECTLPQWMSTALFKKV